MTTPPANPATFHMPRADAFAKGADIGWLQQMEATGFTFRGPDGSPQDPLHILIDHGINTVRLRVFVNPSEDPRSGHCGRDEVVAMAARARALGLRVMIDFHYSDSWADPGKQHKPKAWAALPFERLLEAVHDHTHDVLSALEADGVTPEWVQVGNEVPNGMLWPNGRPENGPNLAQLINAGHDAVKAIDARVKVIVHLDRGNERAMYRTFFDDLQRHGCRYDVIGMSYYPYWLKVDYTQNIDDLGRNLIETAERYDKDVMVVEVGGEDRLVDNTYAMLRAVLGKVRAVPGGRGLGVIYWEPAGAFAWSRYRLSCWGDDGRPTRALQAFLERD